MSTAPAPAPEPEPKPKRRPPRFTWSEYVDIGIDPEDLEAAGWVYVGDDPAAPPLNQYVIDVVMRWHDSHHPGPWRWCDDDLCDQLRERDTF